MKRYNLNLRTQARTATVAGFAVLLSAIGAGGQSLAAAGDAPRLPVHFGGLLNDYTPQSEAGVAIKGSPYEMHGKWSLELNERDGAAVFTAEMTMETADFANSDMTNHDPTKLGPHTHHIRVGDGVVHNDPGDPTNWKASCPAFSPAVTGGFVVTGTAYVTGNGGNPPFGNPSPVTLCVLGGMSTGVAGTAYVTFANFTLAFGSNSHASTHFGSQAINGVVLECGVGAQRDAQACRVAVVN